jgi:hypothetical protein
MVSLGASGLEVGTGQLELNVEKVKTLNQGTLNGGSTEKVLISCQFELISADSK